MSNCGTICYVKKHSLCMYYACEHEATLFVLSLRSGGKTPDSEAERSV